MNHARGVLLLLITGTMGAGKTSVLGEASDLLDIQRIEHAAIDVDTLGLAWLASAPNNNDVMYANLECVCRNYARLGVQRFLLVRAVESRAELERCIQATSSDKVVVCRLTSELPTLQERIRRRETGIRQAECLARVEALNAVLDRAALEDFTLSNDHRSITEVAHEMLVRAGWLVQ